MRMSAVSLIPSEAPQRWIHAAMIGRRRRRLRRDEVVHEVVHGDGEVDAFHVRRSLPRRIHERPVQRFLWSPRRGSPRRRVRSRRIGGRLGEDRRKWGAGGVAGGGGLDLLEAEAPVGGGDAGRGGLGEVEAGPVAAEAGGGGVEGAGSLLRRVIGSEPDPLAAVGEADLRHPPPPFPLPHSLIPRLPHLRSRRRHGRRSTTAFPLLLLRHRVTEGFRILAFDEILEMAGSRCPVYMHNPIMRAAAAI